MHCTLICIVEAIRRLKINNNRDRDAAAQSMPYPDRPGEPDCLYYLRTGMCGYGSNCRYNHPANVSLVIGPFLLFLLVKFFRFGFIVCSLGKSFSYFIRFQVTQYGEELPERVGQPDCEVCLLLVTKNIFVLNFFFFVSNGAS